MKKVLILLVMPLLICSGLHAQSKAAFYNPSNTDGRTDTVINAGTTYLKAAPATVGPLGVHIICTKVSGTVSGTAYLEAGADLTETSYVTIDSLVLGNNATNTLLRGYSYNPYSKYRWRIVTSGSQAFIVRAYYSK